MKADVMRRFLEELEAGEIPRTATTEEIAAEFSEMLKSKRRRGRPGRTVGDLKPLWDFMQKAIAADPKQRGARERAIEAAAAEFRVDPSTVERAWDPYAAVAKKMRPAIELMQLIRVHFTDSELEELGETPLPQVAEMARERAKQRRQK